MRSVFSVWQTLHSATRAKVCMLTHYVNPLYNTIGFNKASHSFDFLCFLDGKTVF